MFHNKINKMRKLKTFIILLLSVFIMQQCSNTKKIVTKEKAAVTEKVVVAENKELSFEKDISPILKASCTPCHYPPNGNKEPLDTYAAAKSNVNEILERVKLPKDARGFMPFKNPKRALTDSAIMVIEQWKKEGMKN
jgi:uncharacterized membrane protein